MIPQRILQVGSSPPQDHQTATIAWKPQRAAWPAAKADEILVEVVDLNGSKSIDAAYVNIHHEETNCKQKCLFGTESTYIVPNRSSARLRKTCESKTHKKKTCFRTVHVEVKRKMSVRLEVWSSWDTPFLGILKFQVWPTLSLIREFHAYNCQMPLR